MEQISWFDILVVIITIITLIKGYTSGLVMQIATLGGVLLGTVFAGVLAKYISPLLLNWTKAEIHIIAPLSYIISFILIFIALILLGRSLQSVIKVVKMNFLNRIAGSIFCLTAWMIVLSILLNTVLEFDKNNKIISLDLQTKSYAYPIVKEISPLVAPFLRFDWYQDKARNILHE